MEHWILFLPKNGCNTIAHVVDDGSNASPASVLVKIFLSIAKGDSRFGVLASSSACLSPSEIDRMWRDCGETAPPGSTGSVQINHIDNIWTTDKIMRKHNFKDEVWRPDTIEIITQRVNSEFQKAQAYHPMEYNSEQFAHFCRYGKRYSGQVAAFSKGLKTATWGVVNMYDEFD